VSKLIKKEQTKSPSVTKFEGKKVTFYNVLTNLKETKTEQKLANDENAQEKQKIVGKLLFPKDMIV